MNLKCYFQFEDGNFCKKWAMNASRFCNNHQPPAEAEAQPNGSGGPATVPLHPYARLATTKELFELVRHTLYSTSTGAISPAQAYAISSLVTQWLHIHTALRTQDRNDALTNQILATLVDPALADPELPEPDPDPQPASQPATAAPLEETAAEAHCDAAAFARPTSHSPLATNRLPHDPWAAGRMAGPVPVNSPPVDIREAQAKLEALLAEQARTRTTNTDSS